MAEELRIIVTDEGGSSGPSAPSAPGGGGGAAPGGGGGGRPPGGPKVFDAVPAEGAGISAQEINIGEAIGSQLVSGDIWGAAKTTLKAGAVAASEVIGVAALGIAAGLGVAAVAAVSFANMVERQTEALAGLSGAVAEAQANTEVRRFQSQVRRADRIGSDLAGAENARSRFETVTTDIWTEVLGVLLNIWNRFEPLADTLLTFAEESLAWIEVLQPVIELLIETAAKVAPGIGAIIQQLDVISKVAQAFGFGDDDGEAEDPFGRDLDTLIEKQNLNAPNFFPNFGEV